MRGAEDQWAEVVTYLLSCDSNGDGVLSREEFISGLSIVGTIDATQAFAIANSVLCDFIYIGCKQVPIN